MHRAKSPAPLDRVGAGITCALLLAFTGATPAVADEPPDPHDPLAPVDPRRDATDDSEAAAAAAIQPQRAPDDDWIQDPYQPHDTTGANVRFGSAVGSIVHDGRAYTALGGAIAAGPRIGRFTVEADYLLLELTEPGPSSLYHGRAHRLGIMGRVDAVRLGPHFIGKNSLLAIYAEAGVARQWHGWARPGIRDAPRAIPVDASFTTGVVGFGFNLDHRLEQPRGFPNRIGWQLGWQLTSTRDRAPDPMIVCRGPSTCVAGPTMEREASHNTALLVTSTIAFTW